MWSRKQARLVVQEPPCGIGVWPEGPQMGLKERSGTKNIPGLKELIFENIGA